MPKHPAHRSPPTAARASLRRAERRGNLREPGFSFTGIGLGVLAAPGPVRPANAEASHPPFLAALRKSVIARSRATRQSTRTGVFVHGDWLGSTHSSGAKYWKHGSRRLPRRSVTPVPALLCFEPSTRLATRRLASSITPRNDVLVGWVLGNRCGWMASGTLWRSVSTGRNRDSSPLEPAKCRSIPPTVPRRTPQERHCEEQSDAAIYENGGFRSRGSAWEYSQVAGRCSAPRSKHPTYRSSPRSAGASLRGVERRDNLRDPGFSFTGIGLGVIAAPGPVLPANAEASQLPLLAALRKSVIARSSATRQSTRTGVFVHGDWPGSTHRL